MINNRRPGQSGGTGNLQLNHNTTSSSSRLRNFSFRPLCPPPLLTKQQQRRLVKTSAFWVNYDLQVIQEEQCDFDSKTNTMATSLSNIKTEITDGQDPNTNNSSQQTDTHVNVTIKSEPGTSTSSLPSSSNDDEQLFHEGIESESTIFVGGFNRCTTENDLKRYFTRFGEVLHAKVVTHKWTGQSRRFGFVTFHKKEYARRAVNHNNGIHQLQDKQITVRESYPKLPTSRGYADRKVFVGGLSVKANVDDLKKYFEAFGKVKKIEMPRAHEDPKFNRGYAFILFDSDVSAKKVRRMKYHFINHKKVECKLATSAVTSERDINITPTPMTMMAWYPQYLNLMAVTMRAQADLSLAMNSVYGNQVPNPNSNMWLGQTGGALHYNQSNLLYNPNPAQNQYQSMLQQINTNVASLGLQGSQNQNQYQSMLQQINMNFASLGLEGSQNQYQNTLQQINMNFASLGLEPARTNQQTPTTTWISELPTLTSVPYNNNGINAPSSALQNIDSLMQQ